MKKFRVRGTAIVEVFVEVEAEDEFAALDAADDIVSSLEQYAGNGGCDKIVGVDAEEASVDVGDAINWEDAEEIGDVVS